MGDHLGKFKMKLTFNSSLLCLRDGQINETVSSAQGQRDKKVVGARNKFPKRPQNRRNAYNGKWRCIYSTEYMCEMFARVALVL